MTQRYQDDCDVCSGRGFITLPVRSRMVAYSEAAEMAPQQSSRRDFKCPQCTPAASEDRVCVVTQISDVSIMAGGPDFDRHLKTTLSRALGEAILNAGEIEFRTGPAEKLTGVRRLTATVGIVSKAFVASLEQRVAARQAEIAKEVATEAKRQISLWGSDYVGNQGTIYKHVAREAVEEALRKVLREREA